eukprot:1718058-Alexandrium_andersonii.AAC.1
MPPAALLVASGSAQLSSVPSSWGQKANSAARWSRAGTQCSWMEHTSDWATVSWCFLRYATLATSTQMREGSPSKAGRAGVSRAGRGPPLSNSLAKS